MSEPISVDPAPPSSGNEQLSANAAPEQPRKWKKWVAWLRRYGSWILLALGLLGVGLLVRSVGAAKLLAVIASAGPLLPFILLLDISWVAFEGGAILVLYGPIARKIPVRAWIEATLIHYTTMTVLPVGRTGAEVARATLVSPHIGATRAAAGAALMQTLTLTANTIISFACLVAVVMAGVSSQLAWLLLANGLATLAIGGGLYLVMRRAKLGGFLGRKFESMAHWGPELDEHFRESRPRHLIALGCGVAARSLQTVQYGVILLAIAGSWSFSGTLVAQGIHLVGAGLGDMVPNQVGITEGAYRVFASALGLADHPEKAVAIALVARVSNLGVAGLCALAVQFVPGRRAAKAHGVPADGSSAASEGSAPSRDSSDDA